jgi:AcrR family transcriptional regulator
MGRPREHGEKTRSALLAVAGQILDADGVESLTVRRVAEAAGTTTRAVYTIFGDKSGLLRALFQTMAETMRRHHEAVPVMNDPFEEIQQLALAYRAAALEQRNLYDFYYRSLRPHAKISTEDAALAFRTFERVLSTLRRIVDAGLFGSRTVDSTGLQLWALVHGLASLELRGFLADSDQVARERWRSAVGAALAGYQQPTRASSF